MIRRLVALQMVAVLAVLAFAAPASALTSSEDVQKSPNDPTSGDLVWEARMWDGKTIEFTGEAIGERMVRGDHAWIHINDDAYYLENVEEGAALGGYSSGHAVWLPTELAEKIRHFGDYTNEGDVVTVRGTFNAACPEHGGDMDIHATDLTVKAAGHRVFEKVALWKVILAVALSAFAALLWLGIRQVERREAGGHPVR